MGIGEILKRAREERGLSLEEVAEKTKIRYRYLEAIEKENFDIMPGYVYVKGFIRNYARFLGLNPEALVALFTERCAGEQPPAEIVAGARPENEKRYLLLRKPLFYVLGVVILCLVLGIYALQQSALFSQERENTPAPADVYGQHSSEPALPSPRQPVQPASPQMVPATREETPEQKGVNLVLNVVKDSCWVSVVVDGETKFTGELMANQKKSFFGKERIQVKLGNAGAVQVQLNGRDLGYLGGRWEVVKREFVASQEG